MADGDELKVVDSQPLPELTVVDSQAATATPPPSKSLWEHTKDTLSSIWDTLPPAEANRLATHLSTWANGRAEQNRQENLQATAQGKQQPHSEATNTALGALGSVGKMTAATTTPAGMATTAGVIAANTNPITAVPVDLALLAHGTSGVVQNAPAAFEGNPDAAEAALLSGSEAVGGAAGLGANVPRLGAATTKAATGAARIVRDPVTGKVRSPYEIALDKVLPEHPDVAATAKPVPITKSPSYDPGAYKAGAATRTTATTPKIKPAMTPAASNAVSEGRPATWTNDVVKELASWGDPDAMAQARARGFGRIPTRFSTADTTPRSVTRFDAAGNVIEEAGKTAAESGMEAANAPRPTSGKLITTPEGASQPRYIYRVRDVGESGIPADVKSHAHATESLAEAQNYLKSRELVQGKPQEIVKLDVSKLKPSEFDELTGPEGANWFKFKRPFPERVVRKVSE